MAMRRREALRSRTRCRLQLHRRFPRRHQRREYGNPDGSFASGPDIIDGPKYPTRSTGIAGRSRSISTTTTSPTRTTTRSKPTAHAQHPRHAEHADQSSVTRLLQSADSGRPGVLDPKHCLQPAGRIDTLTNGAAGVLFYNNTILGDERRGSVEHPLAQQPDAGAELRAGDSERQYVHQLHLFRLQRLPREPWSAGRIRMGRAAHRRDLGFHGSGTRGKAAAETIRVADGCVSATGQDRHSVAVDYDVFVNVKRLDAQDAASVQKLYKADEFDFRLKPASAAVDKGVALSTVTEGFAGRAPDLGLSSSDSRCRTMGPGSRCTKLGHREANLRLPLPSIVSWATSRKPRMLWVTTRPRPGHARPPSPQNPGARTAPRLGHRPAASSGIRYTTAGQ